MDNVFYQVFILTFTMLMAIGPICLTVINIALKKGLLCVLYAGFGVSTADTLYILFATFLLDKILIYLQNNILIYIFGSLSGLFLISLSIQFWKHEIKNLNANKLNDNRKSKLKIFLHLFTITLTGPTTIITYAAIFSNFVEQNFSQISIISGAICATFSFYILLVLILIIIRKKMTIKFINIINKFSSIIILTYGIIILYKSINMIMNLIILKK